jgi:hypothetical protein
MEIRKPDPTDVSDGVWAFVAPSPTPVDEVGPRRRCLLKIKERAG